MKRFRESSADISPDGTAAFLKNLEAEVEEYKSRELYLYKKDLEEEETFDDEELSVSRILREDGYELLKKVIYEGPVRRVVYGIGDRTGHVIFEYGWNMSLSDVRNLIKQKLKRRGIKST